MKITKTIFAGRTEWRNEKGEPHRLDGPAVEFADGYKAWYQNGFLHRLDGPATESPQYNTCDRWYFNGIENCFQSLQNCLNILKDQSNIKKFIKGIIYTDINMSEMFLLRLTISNHFSEHTDFLIKLLIIR